MNNHENQNRRSTDILKVYVKLCNICPDENCPCKTREERLGSADLSELAAI